MNEKLILDTLAHLRPEFDFASTTDYLDEGMLDSLDIVTLVSDLDSIFSISIEGIDIVPENFRNLRSIQGLLSKYGVSR